MTLGQRERGEPQRRGRTSFIDTSFSCLHLQRRGITCASINDSFLSLIVDRIHEGTVGQNNQEYKLKCWATRLSIRPHHSLIRLLCPACFALALCCTHSLACSLISLTPLFIGKGNIRWLIFLCFFLFWTIAEGKHGESGEIFLLRSVFIDPRLPSSSSYDSLRCMLRRFLAVGSFRNSYIPSSSY